MLGKKPESFLQGRELLAANLSMPRRYEMGAPIWNSATTAPFGNER